MPTVLGGGKVQIFKSTYFTVLRKKMLGGRTTWIYYIVSLFAFHLQSAHVSRSAVPYLFADTRVLFHNVLDQITHLHTQ